MRNRCSSAVWVIVLAAINLCFGNAVGVAADSLEFPSTGCDQVMIDVTVLFDEPISDADIALFGAHGGSIGRVFKQIAHGWIGSIPVIRATGYLAEAGDDVTGFSAERRTFLASGGTNCSSHSRDFSLGPEKAIEIPGNITSAVFVRFGDGALAAIASEREDGWYVDLEVMSRTGGVTEKFTPIQKHPSPIVKLGVAEAGPNARLFWSEGDPINGRVWSCEVSAGLEQLVTSPETVGTGSYQTSSGGAHGCAVIFKSYPEMQEPIAGDPALNLVRFSADGKRLDSEPLIVTRTENNIAAAMITNLEGYTIVHEVLDAMSGAGTPVSLASAFIEHGSAIFARNDIDSSLVHTFRLTPFTTPESLIAFEGTAAHDRNIYVTTLVNGVPRPFSFALPLGAGDKNLLDAAGGTNLWRDAAAQDEAVYAALVDPNALRVQISPVVLSEGEILGLVHDAKADIYHVLYQRSDAKLIRRSFNWTGRPFVENPRILDGKLALDVYGAAGSYEVEAWVGASEGWVSRDVVSILETSAQFEDAAWDGRAGIYRARRLN